MPPGAAPAGGGAAVSPPSSPDWAARLKRSLLAGLAVVLPAVLTVYILWLLFQITGALFARPAEFLTRHLVGRDLAGARSRREWAWSCAPSGL